MTLEMTLEAAAMSAPGDITHGSIGLSRKFPVNVSSFDTVLTSWRWRERVEGEKV